MRKILIATILTISSIVALQAQFSMGLRGGATFGSVQAADVVDMVTPNFKLVPGFEIGVSGKYEISDRFSVLGEANYSQKGFRVAETMEMGFLGNLPLGISVNTRVGYINVPIMARYDLGTGPLHAYVAVGPEFGYATHGHIKARADALFDLTVIDRRVNLSSINYERFDVGAVAAVGAEYDTPFGEVFVDARFHQGFKDLINLPVVDLKVRSFGIGLGAGVRMNF